MGEGALIIFISIMKGGVKWDEKNHYLQLFVSA